MPATLRKPREDTSEPQVAGVQHRSISVAKIPTKALFEPWELVGWKQVNESLKSGNAVFVEIEGSGINGALSDDDAHNWRTCAERQIGMLNACFLFDFEGAERGLWIVPEKSLELVTPECHEAVYQ